MSVTYRFSARKLHFPGLCCCCGRPRSGHVYRAAYTRETGVRVVRSYSKWWDFPICRPCDDWRQAIADADAARSGYNLLVFGAVAGLVGVVLLLPAAAFGGFGVFVADELRGRMMFVVFAGTCLFGAAASGAGGYVAWLRIEPARRRMVRLADEAEDARPKGAADPEPIDYHGWYGSVHTFTFHNERFGEAFAGVNRRKVVY